MQKYNFFLKPPFFVHVFFDFSSEGSLATPKTSCHLLSPLEKVSYEQKGCAHLPSPLQGRGWGGVNHVWKSISYRPHPCPLPLRGGDVAPWVSAVSVTLECALLILDLCQVIVVFTLFLFKTFGGLVKSHYLCNVFFIVLDLRLTKVGVQRYSFFLCTFFW